MRTPEETFEEEQRERLREYDLRQEYDKGWRHGTLATLVMVVVVEILKDWIL